MEADIHELYASDFYRILDFKCRCTDCAVSRPEYASSFCISFIRKGNFLFNVFRHSYDSHTGRVLVTKPGYEHTVAHIHTVPDECSIFDFKTAFYEQLAEEYGKRGIDFFKDPDLHSLLLNSTIRSEYLHRLILRIAITQRPAKLELDGLVIEMVQSIMSMISGRSVIEPIKRSLKRNHLLTIETARAYIAEHFADDISLRQIAEHCHVSPFHFSRIFKTFTSYSPHQYLLQLRLTHAELLLVSSNDPITDISFSCGFNSLENFSALFALKNGLSPSRFREQCKAPSLSRISR